MARLLVADDESSMREMLAMGLRHEGFDVCAVSNGAQALEAVATFRPDAVVLDVMMPGMDGFEVCRRMAQDEQHPPVIFLSARRDLPDRLTGLSIGADDYLTKPFSFEELVARIRVLLRRRASPSLPDKRIQVADLVVDEATREVRRAGHLIDLTATEFNLLQYLAANARRVVSKRQILDAVWEYDYDGDPSVVETFIYYLRKKVDRFDPALIQTVRGVGYVMRPPQR